MQRVAGNAYIEQNVVLPRRITIGPFCVIKEGAQLGEGVVLGAGCVVENNAIIGRDCKLGNYVTVGAEAEIGDGTQIGDHSAITLASKMGKGCHIGSLTTIGRAPRPAATSTVRIQADLPALQMGDDCTIGCSAVIYAGSEYGNRVFIGDGAVVRERVKLSDSVLIGCDVVVENDTRIGALTKVQTGSYITAYMNIEECVFIAPMVTTTNDNFMGRTEKRYKFVKGATIERGARIGAGCILLPSVKVAEESFVAAGALVTKDTRPMRIVKGLPAKDVGEVPWEELLP